MIEALFESNNYHLKANGYDRPAARSSAANLANANTPGYKRVDIDSDFAASLKDALSGKSNEQIDNLSVNLAVDSLAPKTDATGNTVDIEKEMVLLSENQIQHQLESRMISGRMSRLRLAIKGGQ